MNSQEDLAYAICSSLSIVGSIFIITVAILLRFKTQLLKVLTWISVSDLILCLPYWLLPQIFATCIITSFLEEFAIISSFVWTASVAFVYRRTIKRRDEMIGEKNYKKIIIFALITSILLGGASIADKFFTDAMNLGQCNSPTQLEEPDLRFWIHMGIPFYITFLYITACYIYAMVKIRRLFKSKGIRSRKPFGLLVYPICIIICWGPLIFSYTLEQFGVISLSHNQLIWMKVFVRLQGILNAIFYGVSRQTRDSIKELCPGTGRWSKSTNETLFGSVPLLNETSGRLDTLDVIPQPIHSQETPSKPEKFVVSRNG